MPSDPSAREKETVVSSAPGRSLRLAEHLDDRELLAFALRVHGNELRKVDRSTAAIARLETRLLEAFERGGQAEAVALAARYGLVPDPDPPGPVPRLIRSV